MTVINVIVTIATVILVYVALSDIRSRKISNTASGLLFVNSMLYCGLLGYWTQLLVVIPVFIFGFLLWQIGIWGPEMLSY
ncbi:A24 family peptidase [Vibrio algarum]|uniref:Prepilin peptidase n=1 Tax=Vibrio algarum TaxID=3020714 RepID=A0ABT4YNK4_9VIBR|nr:hypothetical protein [Vibrio sp. KJ40-1]MDB1123127.1 hypothetical protein [Vibrio sp. KJ40-1]